MTIIGAPSGAAAGAAGLRASRLQWWRRIGLLVAVTLVMLVGASPTAGAARESVGTAFGRPCGALTIIAIPGTHETNDAAGMDVARAMLENVTRYVNRHADRSVRTHYLGYPAELWKYDSSRQHGYQAAWSTLDYYARQCPTSRFVLLGYSQGAHVAGDLAASIAHQSSPIPAARIRSVRLLADPARPTNLPVVGMPSAGSGGLLGRRDFGSLNDRIAEYCGDRDGICNRAPGAVANLVPTLFRGGPHTRYATTAIPGSRQTFTERLSDDLVQDIVNLNGVTY